MGYAPPHLYLVVLLMTLGQTSTGFANITSAVEDGIRLVSGAERPVRGRYYGPAVIVLSWKHKGANCLMHHAGQSALSQDLSFPLAMRPVAQPTTLGVSGSVQADMAPVCLPTGKMSPG
jgi:hypothetical protein